MDNFSGYQNGPESDKADGKPHQSQIVSRQR